MHTKHSAFIVVRQYDLIYSNYPQSINPPSAWVFWLIARLLSRNKCR